MTTWDTPVLILLYTIRSRPVSNSPASTRSQGSVIRILTRSPWTWAPMMPARVSKRISAPAMPWRKAKRAAHRAPLPHISAMLPSELKKRQRKSARSEASSRIRPSAPTDIFRRQIRAANSDGSSNGTTDRRLSIRIKSLPLPLILKKGISFMTALGLPARIRHLHGHEIGVRSLGARTVNRAHTVRVGEAGCKALGEIQLLFFCRAGIRE